MASFAERWRRDVRALKRENARLKGVEAELAAALESLRASEERLRLAVDAAEMGLWEWDMTSDRVTWDGKKHDLFGLAHGSFAGTKEAFFELVHPDDRRTLEMAIRSALKDGSPYRNEFRVLAPSGGIRWIANLGQVYRDDDGRPVRMIGVVYDITDRKESERALLESETKFRSIVETTSEWAWEIDANATITYSNPAVERILGYRPDELEGRSLRSLVHPEDLPRAEQVVAISVAEKRGWAPFVIRCRHKDGAHRYLECQGVPIVDVIGNVVGVRGCDRDVTDRRQAEEDLREAYRMDGIGRLAGGFAHHFNNPLTVIVGRVELALEASRGQALDADLQAIRQAAQRSALLTRQLLTFARKQVVTPRVLNLNDQLETMGASLHRLVGSEITLVMPQPSRIWEVAVDPAQLELVVMNLVANACEAMPHGGILTIATANVAADDESAPRGAEVVNGDYVMLSVNDTGKGMTEDIGRRIFEPFFTTKDLGSNTDGLGLSICYGVVAQQGGHIRFETQPDRGSTFRVYLTRHCQADERGA